MLGLLLQFESSMDIVTIRASIDFEESFDQLVSNNISRSIRIDFEENVLSNIISDVDEKTYKNLFIK